MIGASERLIRRHPLVGRDVMDIADYIGRDSPEAARRFFVQIQTTLTGLAEMPGKGPRCGFRVGGMNDVRFYPVNGFPNHVVFYRPKPDGIYVLSVRHGARNLPGDLRKRIE